MEYYEIFVTGGAYDKIHFVTVELFRPEGIQAASLGRLLKQRGLKVAAQKIDPYEYRPGHHESFPAWRVFVTDDGAETDLTSDIMSAL